MNALHVGLCDGRHMIVQNDGTPVTEFIFAAEVEDPLDFASFHHVVIKRNNRWKLLESRNIVSVCNWSHSIAHWIPKRMGKIGIS